jgi:hypothetical protein
VVEIKHPIHDIEDSKRERKQYTGRHIHFGHTVDSTVLTLVACPYFEVPVFVVSDETVVELVTAAFFHGSLSLE